MSRYMSTPSDGDSARHKGYVAGQLARKRGSEELGNNAARKEIKQQKLPANYLVAKASA